MTDYASLGAPPDPEEVRDCEKTPRLNLARHEDIPHRPRLHQSVRDVVFGSGEIIVDNMKYTVSHVVEPVEWGLAKISLIPDIKVINSKTLYKYVEGSS
ncbi:putative organic solute transporter subunit alpha/Transmembrane protein [Helianthus debilis subsp. tardiflorus]